MFIHGSARYFWCFVTEESLHIVTIERVVRRYGSNYRKVISALHRTALCFSHVLEGVHGVERFRGCVIEARRHSDRRYCVSVSSPNPSGHGCWIPGCYGLVLRTAAVNNHADSRCLGGLCASIYVSSVCKCYGYGPWDWDWDWDWDTLQDD